MDNIQPYRYGEDARLMEPLGGTIPRSELDFVVRAIIVVSCGAAFTILGVVEFRIQMTTEPNQAFQWSVPSVNNKVGAANDQECYPTVSEEEPEAEGVNEDVNKAREGFLILVQGTPIWLSDVIAQNMN